MASTEVQACNIRRHASADGQCGVADQVGPRLRADQEAARRDHRSRAQALYKRERLGAAKTQSRLREMNEILTRVAGWAGGPAQAMAWYRAEPIPAFGGRTAESLVKSGQAGQLRDYLDSIAIGGFA